MGGLSLSRSEEHNCAFCENAVHNPDHRIAIGIFDPSQNAQARRAPQRSWNYKQQSRQRYAARRLRLVAPCRVLGLHSLGCRNRASAWSPPSAQRRGTTQSDRRRITRSSAHACAFRATLIAKRNGQGEQTAVVPTYASIWGMRDVSCHG